MNNQLIRQFSTSFTVCVKKRPSAWTLPDLEKLPGGFRGKVYNKRNWDEYLSKNIDGDVHKTEHTTNLKAPPKNWRRIKDLPEYMKQKYALREKKIKMGPEGQRQLKKLSRAATEGIKELHDKYPEELTTDKLAEFFKVSPIAISKILKSRWSPSEAELVKSERRWERHTRERATNIMIESQFKEFIANKESQLNMEIPEFFKIELYNMYKAQGIEYLRKDFDELNDARIAKQKFKDERLENDINNH